MGTVFYGSELAQELRNGMKTRVEGLQKQGRRIPRLSVILAGENPASLSYVRGKQKACASVGIESSVIRLPADVSQAGLEAEIDRLNEDPAVDGILVQLPLPAGLDENRAIRRIDPRKDVDGLHPLNVGRLYLGEEGFVPCTPRGCMEILKRMEAPLDGCRAVVVGRSHLVGSPVARLLQNENATVTICHSHTQNLREICRQADVLVVAIGQPHYIDHTYVKEGAYVIDVGISRAADGSLKGDVDFDDVLPVAKTVTPVPKGVGPMTICMLLDNTLKAYEEREAHGLRSE